MNWASHSGQRAAVANVFHEWPQPSGAQTHWSYAVGT
jgi:hypothetical protein